MTEALKEPPRTFEVGPDRVAIEPEQVVIDARRPIPNWDLRETNHVPVYVEEKKYYLVQKRRGESPYAVRYLLKPWPEYQATNATGFLSYDLEAVKDRDGDARENQFQEIGRAFLMPLYPLLGFLWSGMQTRLTRFGFLPHAMTGFSVFTSFSLVFGQGVFAVIMLNSSLRTGKILIGGFIRALAPGDTIQAGPVGIPVALLDLLLVTALIVDVIARYSNYLRDDQWAGGFLEWLLPRRKQNPVKQPGATAQ